MYNPQKISGDVYLLNKFDIEEQISTHWSTQVPWGTEVPFKLYSDSGVAEALGFIYEKELDEWDKSDIFSAIECGYYAYCPYLFIQQLVNDGVFPPGYYIIDLS